MEDGRSGWIRKDLPLPGSASSIRISGHVNNIPQLVLLAMGFLGPQKEVLEQLGVEQERGTVRKLLTFILL